MTTWKKIWIASFITNITGKFQINTVSNTLSSNQEEFIVPPLIFDKQIVQYVQGRLNGTLKSSGDDNCEYTEFESNSKF